MIFRQVCRQWAGDDNAEEADQSLNCLTRSKHNEHEIFVGYSGRTSGGGGCDGFPDAPAGFRTARGERARAGGTARGEPSTGGGGTYGGASSGRKASRSGNEGFPVEAAHG